MSHTATDRLDLGRAAPASPARPGGAKVRAVVLAVVFSVVVAGTGCRVEPRMVPPGQRRAIDRALVEYPAGFELQPYIRNLTAPTAVTWDDRGSIIVAAGGVGGKRVHIFGFRADDGSYFQIYPQGRRFWFGLGFRDFIHGPVGGILHHQGKLYVSHRDANGYGRITALDHKGRPTTIIAGLPTRGDYGVTDMAIHPNNGRLYFGVGAATNSGVVGLDNWARGWPRNYPRVHDKPWLFGKTRNEDWSIVLRGLRFDTPNPLAGLFGGADIAVTGPFQPFDVSDQIRVHIARDGRPNAAVYSIPATGGSAAELRVEAHGIRLPRGLAFTQFGTLYATNNGMELRGTRPVKDDPDAVLRIYPGTWYGWPDYSADLRPISNRRFQPPADMLIRTGYPELSFLIDHDASKLVPPDQNELLLRGVFPSQSGAAKMDFVPDQGPFAVFRRRRGDSAIVALSGDRAPFATSGKPLIGYMGYKVVRAEVDSGQVRAFIRNTADVPRHRLPEQPEDALERPVDVKFGPDGSLYVVDMGRMDVRRGRENVTAGTGQVFRLVPVAPDAPAGEPATGGTPSAD